jgi:nitrite reductase/ring-hydroxylating ferredoxin subunit
MAKSGSSERIHPGGQATKFEVSKGKKGSFFNVKGNLKKLSKTCPHENGGKRVLQ